MSKNLFDLRLAIRRRDGFISSIWRAWGTTPGDVYLATRSMAGIAKYSFHSSRICRSAFTRETGAPPTLTNRALFKWRRAVTPPAGLGRAVRAAWIAFPTDFLSRPRNLPSRPTTWIPAAPPGAATYLELSYTAEPEDTVRRLVAVVGCRHLVLYQALSHDEAVFVAYWHADWENRDLTIPGDGKVADLLFTANDHLETGRPIRLTIAWPPADGDPVHIKELGGYAI
jgi:hypothetical protein